MTTGQDAHDEDAIGGAPPEGDAQSPPAKRDFDALVEEHASFVYNVAYRMMGNPEEAEDVSQDAFLSAFRAYERFRGESRVTTWLYRITVNSALMRLRKTKLSRSLTQTGIEDMEIVDWSASPHSEAVNSELSEKIQGGIDQLEPDLRAAVVTRDVQEFSNVEAAEILGITVAALKSRLHRARVLLRNYLADYVAASK